MSTNIVPYGQGGMDPFSTLVNLPPIISRVIYLFQVGKVAEARVEAYKAGLEQQLETRKALLDSLTKIAISTEDPAERMYMFNYIKDLGLMWGQSA